MYNRKGSAESEMSASSAKKFIKKPATLHLISVTQVPENTNCLACSDDGAYLSLGHSRGLSVWSASSLDCEAEWLQDRIEITSIHMTRISETGYLLGTIDEMGVARVFVYNLESLYCFSVINMVDDVSKRSVCLYFELCKGGEHGAIIMRFNSEITLEIYYFPAQDWLRELKDPKISSNMKWSAIVRVNRVNPSTAITTTLPNILSNFLVLDDTSEPPRHCTPHFLKRCGQSCGKIKAKPGSPVSVCFWWTGSHNLLYLLLSKTAKAKQDPEPTPLILWPNASEILCSAVSTCTRFIAVGLSNGLLCVWDRLSSSPLPVSGVSTDSAFVRLHFVDYWPACDDNSQLLTAGDVHLVTLCESGAIHVVSTGRGVATDTEQLSPRPKDSSDLPTVITSVPFLQGLSLVVCRNGNMFLQDVVNKATVCVLYLPAHHVLATPCNPIYALNVKQRILFICADQEPLPGTSFLDDEESQTRLLILRFEEHDTMKPYVFSHPESPWQQKPGVTGEEACNLYFQQRALSMDERHKAITQTWKRLRCATTM
ncbi:WD repeat-containing protein 93 [Corythoichthys intestinalis]|uniref:WD repeat-containing protein 93 n=1 Tax=Corythoichthys intestinalis TaxID=161448 RepID=UPI0025A4EBDC|nr:WD repeat-containing protein 93 [Corythoichthys intestinalis]XP_057705582.1 WD repeat-containing protein 93 [Corythoichthys intestinalis]